MGPQQTYVQVTLALGILLICAITKANDGAEAFKRFMLGNPRIDALADLEQNSVNSTGYPYFDLNVLRNITTVVGQSAFLHCRVHQLGDKSVSWIRKRDLHILTAGIFTYTTDQRFQVIRPDKSENWTLHIKFPQTRDSGIYECQINTEPKMSLAFRLNVIESKARILGMRDLYVKTGSSLTLKCVINEAAQETNTVVFWYKDHHPVQSDHRILGGQNDAADEGRITVDMEWTDTLTSRLKINSVNTSDSGNYSCIPTAASPASVTVHVVSGEHPAAMQHGNTSTAIAGISINLLLVYCVGIHCLIARTYRRN